MTDKGAIVDDWTNGKSRLATIVDAHNTHRHTSETPGEQRTPHCKTLQGIFIKPLLARAGHMAAFPNRQKHTQSIRQKEETEEYVANERQDKIIAITK